LFVCPNGAIPNRKTGMKHHFDEVCINTSKVKARRGNVCRLHQHEMMPYASTAHQVKARCGNVCRLHQRESLTLPASTQKLKPDTRLK